MSKKKSRRAVRAPFETLMDQVHELIAAALNLKSAEGDSDALRAIVAEAHEKLDRARAEIVASLSRSPSPAV